MHLHYFHSFVSLETLVQSMSFRQIKTKSCKCKSWRLGTSFWGDHIKIYLFIEETLRPRLGLSTLVKCSPFMEKCQNNIFRPGAPGL